MTSWGVYVGGHPSDGYVDDTPSTAWTQAVDDLLGLTDPGFRRFSAVEGRRNLVAFPQETLEAYATLPENVQAHSTGISLSIDTSWSFDGSQSLRIQANSSVGSITNTSGGMWITSNAPTAEPVTPGVQYLFRAAVRRAVGNTQAQFTAKWRDPSGAQLGSEVVLGDVTTTIGDVTLFEVLATAPSGAGFVFPIVRWANATPANGNALQVDSMGVWEPVAAPDAGWTYSVTDSASVSDDAARTVAPGDVTDSVAVSDSTARDVTVGNVSDSVGSSDTVSTSLVPGATAQPRLTMTSAGMVQRSGANWRKGGINAFQIVNNDYPSSSGRLMSNSEIDSLLDKAVTLKVGIVRAHTMGANIGPNAAHLVSGISGTGESPTIAYRQAVWDVMDYVVKAAGDRGLYLMIPLTDELAYYHGGKRQWVNFRRPGTVSLDGNVKSANSSDQRAAENYFYTDQQIVWDYRQYTRDWLNHVNSLTGVAYKDDPTIAVLETGNELWTSAQDAPTWAAGWAQFVKGIAPDVLVADGAAADGAALNSTSLDSPYIDIVGTHPYTTFGPSNVRSQAIQAAAKGKAYHVGEYGWSKTAAPSIEQTVRDTGNIFTSMPWSLQNDDDLHNGGHGANYGTDDASFYVPGRDSTMQAANTRVTDHSQSLIDGAAAAVPPSASGGTAGDISDTFDTAGDPNPAKWTVTGNSSQATTSATGGQMLLRTGPTGGYGGKAVLISAATARADQRVVFDATPADLGEAYFQISLRSAAQDGSIGDVSCYRAEVDVASGSVSVARRGGGSVIAPGVSIPGWAAGTQVHFDYSVIGSRIRLWAWTGTTRPTNPLIDVTNTEVTAAGYMGFVLNGGNAATSRQMSLDNFSLTASSPA